MRKPADPDSPTLPAAQVGSADSLGGELVAGRYRLDERIGRGGMSEVWRAEDATLKRDVAVKLLHPGKPDADYARRLSEEAVLVAGLKHPHIVAIHDAGLDGGRPYLVMELLRGRTLSRRLKQGALGVLEATRLLMPIGRALVYAHGQGLVHRDLKPANVFLQDAHGEEVPKLLDFGIARRLDRAGGMTTGWVGTPDFMAPEQLDLGRSLTAAVDQWAFCVLLFEAAVGRTPFGRRRLGETFAAIREAPLPFPRDGGFDGSVFRILARGTRKSPSDRYASMRELLDDLEVWLDRVGDRPAKAPRASTPPRHSAVLAAAPAPPDQDGAESMDEAIATAFGDAS